MAGTWGESVRRLLPGKERLLPKGSCGFPYERPDASTYESQVVERAKNGAAQGDVMYENS